MYVYFFIMSKDANECAELTSPLAINWTKLMFKEKRINQMLTRKLQSI